MLVLAACRSEAAEHFGDKASLVMRGRIGGSGDSVSRAERVRIDVLARHRGLKRPCGSHAGAVFPQDAPARTNSLFMFQAMVTSFHSPRTFSNPRSENCRKPITDLTIPNTGSGICLRSA